MRGITIPTYSQEKWDRRNWIHFIDNQVQDSCLKTGLQTLSQELPSEGRYRMNIHSNYEIILFEKMQIAFTYMTDGFTSSTRHLGKQIKYNMKFLVSKGKGQQNKGNKAKPN